MLAALLAAAAVAATRFGLPPRRAEAYRALGTDLGEPLFSFALFADTQYGTMKPSGMRYYKLSLGKMQEMADFLRGEDIGFIMHLGDLTQDKAAQHRAQVLRPLEGGVPVHHVLGNHDFIGVGSAAEVLRGFGMSERHYTLETPAMRRAGFRFIVVDAAEVSTFGGTTEEDRRSAAELSGQLKRRGELFYKTHNGAVGKRQRAWLDEQLRDACAANTTVVLFSHSPLLTGARNNDMHTWDRNELLALLEKHRCARLWVSGHVHVHRHVVYNVDPTHFVHLWTTSGMVQTPNNSFVVVDVFKDQFLLRGVSWGTSFCKFFNLTAPLAAHNYAFTFDVHYLTRTHLSTPRDLNAPVDEVYPGGVTPPPAAAVTFPPSGRFEDSPEGMRAASPSPPAAEAKPTAGVAAGGASGASGRVAASPRPAVAVEADGVSEAPGGFVDVLAQAAMAVPLIVCAALACRRRRAPRAGA